MALAGALALGLALVVLQALGPGLRPALAELILGLTAIAGLVTVFAGLTRVAWVLLRH
jgi:hypothetical protein